MTRAGRSTVRVGGGGGSSPNPISITMSWPYRTTPHGMYVNASWRDLDASGGFDELTRRLFTLMATAWSTPALPRGWWARVTRTLRPQP